MAGPALISDANPLWNPNTATLKFDFDQAITNTTGTTGVQLTDSAGVLWAGPVSGSDAVGTITMARYPAGTPGTASTVDIAAGTFTGAGGDNLLISDHAFDLAVDHIVPYSRTDLETLYTFLSSIFSTGDFSDYTIAQKSDYSVLLDRLLKPTGTVNAQANGQLLISTRAITQANALIQQFDKYALSSKDAEAFKDLQRAVSTLRAAMPVGGRTFPFAISSTGT